jgi:hypothetical protein
MFQQVMEQQDQFLVVDILQEVEVEQMTQDQFKLQEDQVEEDLVLIVVYQQEQQEQLTQEVEVEVVMDQQVQEVLV